MRSIGSSTADSSTAATVLGHGGACCSDSPLDWSGRGRGSDGRGSTGGRDRPRSPRGNARAVSTRSLAITWSTTRTACSSRGSRRVRSPRAHARRARTGPVVGCRRALDFRARPGRGQTHRSTDHSAGRKDLRNSGASCARRRSTGANRSALSTICGATSRSTPAATLFSRRSRSCARALGDPNVVVATDGGYTLHVDPAEVDALAVLSKRPKPHRCSRRRRSWCRRSVFVDAGVVSWRRLGGCW